MSSTTSTRSSSIVMSTSLHASSQGGRICHPVGSPFRVRHDTQAIESVKNRTAPGPDRIRPEHLKNLPTPLEKTLARLFTRYLSECKVISVIKWSIGKVMLGVTRLTQVRAEIRSSTLRQQSKISDAAVYAKSSKIKRAGDVMPLNDHRWTRAVSDWTPRSEKCTTGTPDSQTSSRSFLKNDMILFVSLKRIERIELHWHVRGTNGRIADVCSVYPTINESQGDQGDQYPSYSCVL
ncbi:hypothetical protein Y032_0090g2370 [Ancylostoma ceylanicum]|nr:hypothetical protein Y032_0090g2370 [Ancylostoma ceylanicum]